MEGMELFSTLALSPSADLYYGPETFNSVFKQTVVETRSLSSNFTYFEGNLTLKVQNGSSKKTKVSKVEIKIDGVVIVSSTDFRKNVNIVSKQLSNLTSTSVLEVTLEGKTGSFIELLIEGTLKEDVIVDIDGNYYHTVQIGTQTWMAENLKTTKYRNGNLIGTTTPATLDISAETNAKYQWAYEGNDLDVVPMYGRLYTWFAVTDSRNVCPADWHLPTITEWGTLTKYLKDNGYGYPGGLDIDVAKSMASTSHWNTSTVLGAIGNDQASNNSSGFTAEPGGIRFNNRDGLYFRNFRYGGHWWTATENNTYFQLFYSVASTLNGHYFDYIHIGQSVRCLKD
jgi:uncharacterized protein (TIGR02145 family)